MSEATAFLQMDLQFRPASSPSTDRQANVMQDGRALSWQPVAEKYWLKSTPSKVKPETIKNEIWEPLEREAFSLHTLYPLETLQVLERFLWPTFCETSSNQHVLLIAIFFNVKQQAELQSWALFADRTDTFSELLRRVLSLSLDTSLSAPSQLALLNFIIRAFGSLEKEFVRKECAPLVSIGIWHTLHSDAAREKELAVSNGRKKAWRAAQKRFEAATPEAQARSKFERSWLSSMTLDFMKRVSATTMLSSDVVYCERFLELLVDLISQLPTRRYTIALFNDLNLLPVLTRSRMYQNHQNALLKDLTALYHHFATFTVDNSDAQEDTQSALESAHYKSLARLQRVAYKHFESQLKVLALSNYSSIDTRSDLEQHFNSLNDDEVAKLCELLGLRTTYPPSAEIPSDRKLWQEVLVQAYTRPADFRDVVRQMSPLPAEKSLYDPKALRVDTYDGVGTSRSTEAQSPVPVS